MADSFREHLASGALWLPGLSRELAADAWAELSGRGIGPANYSTARLLSDLGTGPGLAVEVIPPSGLRAEITIERPSPAVQAHCAALGLEFATAAQLQKPEVAMMLGTALDRLTCATSLPPILSDLVRSLHVLEAGDADCDVSYSSPDLPFSIFVSVPPPGAPAADLRLAEGVLHEAMHLQLTLVEAREPLLRDGTDTFYSPWMRRPRPAQGVLHGLYVFAVIGQVLALVRPRDEREARYLMNRRAEIREQLQTTESALKAGGSLTEAGHALIDAIANRHGLS